MKVLIVDDLHPALIQRFEAEGWQVDYKPEIKPDMVKEQISNYEILILRSKLIVDADLLELAGKLKIIGRSGAGLDNIDVRYAEKKGIKVFSSNEGNQDAVAEHTVGFILSMLHNLHRANQEVRNYTWKREANRGVELKNKTVGLIGYGYMGKAVARRLKGFDCDVIAYDKYLTQYSDDFAREVSLEELKQQADIISLHIPLTEETKAMIDRNFFDTLGKSIYFINTSRGKIVSSEAVIYGLKKGKIIKAALDVLENEKLGDLDVKERSKMEELIHSNKVIFSPHVAGWSIESYAKLSAVLAQKILEFSKS